MSLRLPVSPAPGPLEVYAQAFDDLLPKRSQRESFRCYLEGLRLPTERNKTLTRLANTEPVVGIHHPAAQRLQWFLTESPWDPAVVNHRRCSSGIRRRPHMPRVSWSSMKPAIGSGGRKPPTSGVSIWARSAKSITGLFP
jgi:hypothetical protein